jgi:uncharacterized sulfatase
LRGQDRFNIITILTDDQALWTVRSYGNPQAVTPHIDRLARDGARFTNAFVATPVCSPSRVTFLTGLYPTRTGITDYISNGPGFEAEAGLGLPPETTSWPEVLQQNGYTTALIGKWHLGSLPRFHPTRHGFDHFFGLLHGFTTPLDPEIESQGTAQKFQGSLEDILTDNAIEFIRENRDRPFALVLSTRAPHLPFGPVLEADSAPYRNLDLAIPDAPGLDPDHIRELTRAYHASVHSVDRNLGRLLAKLEELELADKTIVLFTSDHGYMIGHHGLQEKGNAWTVTGGVDGPFRPNMFDEAIRVPLIVRWPGVTQPGSLVEQLVSNVDLYSSILGMLGISAPPGATQDGRDFSPLLRGQQIPWNDAVYGQYDLHHFSLAFMRMIRTPKWKLVRFHFANNLNELYDLEADPGETNNLYYLNRFQHNPAYSQTVDQLEQRLLQWQRSIDDPILSPEYDSLQPLNQRRRPPSPASRP